MESGPTMLYSYYETRAGGRNKGAVSTRGAIQVGKYTGGGLTGQIKGKLLTTFSLLKGHPFERHFDLTFDNIYKIANIIMGNTQGALEFNPEQQVNEFAPGNGDDREPNEEEMLRQLASMWWLGTEQHMAKAQKTLDAMGWEIGQDESGDDDAGVFLIRVGDTDGKSYIAFNHSDLEDLNEGSSQDYLDEK
jgi:hypothetical protein